MRIASLPVVTSLKSGSERDNKVDPSDEDKSVQELYTSWTQDSCHIINNVRIKI